MPALKVACLTLYPVETASTRQRIHKNVRFFPDDIQATILPGVTSAALRRLERRGSGKLARLLFVLEEVGRRLFQLWRARQADLILVQKGLTVMNLRGLPTLLFALGKPVVFDFDDAVYLGPPQRLRSPWLSRLQDPAQIEGLMRRCAAVVAGNPFLAGVARRSNPRVSVIVTPMDTDWYAIAPARDPSPLVIGWSGSTATNPYVNRLGAILGRIAGERPGVEFRVISNDDRGIEWERFAGLPTRFVPWRLETLVDDLQAFDIGLMPLGEDEWSQAKCGGKILQYMACGIPTVASPVGINREVIEPGVNGWLAGDDEAWVAAIRSLIDDPELRRRMGLAARDKVLREHSNRVTAPQLAAVLRQAARGDGAGLAG